MSNLKTKQSLVILLLVISTLFGCNKTPADSANNLPKVNSADQGGVDGSGGNLTTTAEKDFNLLVTKDIKYFIRDAVHRLFLIRKNSPQDISYGTELNERFLGSNEEELMKFIMSIKYYTVSNSCPGTNHKFSDGAALENGKICFSYEAFKRMPKEYLITQLIVLSLHEISHLRGFNEADAQKWQNIFESYPLDKMVILTNNSDLQTFRKKLASIQYSTTEAFQYLITKNIYDNKNEYCDYLAQAEQKGRDSTDHEISARLPTYLDDQYSNTIKRSILISSFTCTKKTKLEIANEMSAILQSFIDFQKQLELFETPLCVDDLCYFKRSFSDFSSPELSLNNWKIRKNSFVKNEFISAIDSSKVSCEIKNLSTHQTTLFEKFNENKDDIFELSKIDSTFETIFITPSQFDKFDASEGYKNSKEIMIHFWHKGPFKLIESNGFVFNKWRINGLLSSNTPGGKISIRFAKMSTQEEHGIAPSSLPYTYVFAFDRSDTTLKEAPQVENEFELSCSLN